MIDVAVLGELLIDFTESGLSANGQRLFEQNPGGAVANVACAVAKLGLRSAFIGKVGKDMHGAFLTATLQKAGVDVRGLVAADDVFTTLAFVSLSDSGEREFSFARKPGADTCLRPEELSREVLESCRIFHVGSLSMTDEPARSATLEAVALAKKAGAKISYDPNYRAPLWKSREDAQENMRRLLPFADLVKISDEETELLTGCSAPEEALRAILAGGAAAAVVTLGKRGALVGAQGCAEVVPTFDSVKTVDTTGAGDSFWGAFLYKILSGKPLEQLTFADFRDDARFANAAATLCVTKRGAIPAMPDAASVEKLLREAGC